VTHTRRVPSRAGFTLVEILVVVVVLLVLVSLVVPRFQRYKAKAYTGSIMNDLRKLAVAQEDYFALHAHYAPATESLQVVFSPGVQITVQGGEFGWSGIGTHPLAQPLRCAVYWGKADPPPPAKSEGQVTCE
jgi:prepilin-type N-terminal cleavage/methylation domain-containing protein